MTTLEEEWGTAVALSPPAQRGVPWEDPELSGWMGFYRTLRDLLFSPRNFLRTWVREAGPSLWPLPSSCPPRDCSSPFSGTS